MGPRAASQTPRKGDKSHRPASPFARFNGAAAQSSRGKAAWPANRSVFGERLQWGRGSVERGRGGRRGRGAGLRHMRLQWGRGSVEARKARQSHSRSSRPKILLQWGRAPVEPRKDRWGGTLAFFQGASRFNVGHALSRAAEGGNLLVSI